MSKPDLPRFPALRKPPIVEVVCGVVFESIPTLDALVLGTYWASREKDFPQRSLQPAIADEAGLALGMYPLRAFIVSADDQFILQLQHDRFFMNWRASGGDYPHFSDHHGTQGLKRRALEEFDRFATFVEQRMGQRPVPKRIELTKIDLLKRGDDWQSLDDLTRLLPVTGTFSQIQRTDRRDVNLRFVERGDDGTVIVHVATLVGDGGPNAVRIEARRIIEVSEDLAESFSSANDVLNEVFFRLIPEAQARFGLKEGSIQ